MTPKEQNLETLDESQSLRVIKEMIEVSQKKMKNDGVLFIVWGWISFVTYLFEYIKMSVPHTMQFSNFMGYFNIVLAIFGITYTIFYLYRKSRKATTYVGISIRYVWISMFAAMVLINLIQGNVLHKIEFELQLPIFMILVSFALVVTGGILRYKIVIASGIAFGLLAYYASFFSLYRQLLIEAIAWFVAFVVPGHILFAKRKS